MNRKLQKIGGNERGSAALVGMILLAFAVLTLLSVMTFSSFRESRMLDLRRTVMQEKWQARGAVNILARIVAKDAPRQFQEDTAFALENCDAPTSLPFFDPENTERSQPAVSFENGEIGCKRQAAGEWTSIFGSVETWAAARRLKFESTASSQFSLDGENIRVVEIKELYRREDGNVTAYAARYVVEAKAGNYRTRTSGEIVFGANLPNCGTSVIVEINPPTVERGQPVEMTITYTSANRLEIYDSGNTLLHEESVLEQSNPQTFVYRFSPSSSNEYYVRASSSGGCRARSANTSVVVTEPPPPACPRIVDFSASSTTINAGETVTLSWNVQDAFEVRFEGNVVAATGSQAFTLNETRTFTLMAQDAANNCPVIRQITVTVRPLPPSCAFSTPQISFSANPTMIAVGESSNLNWTIQSLDATAGTAIITGPNGFSQTISAAGNLSVTPPASPGDYTYTLTAENVCPDGTRLTATATVVISVRACPPPVITVFTANPSVVSAGGNQLVTFSWNIDGTADSVSINNGVGGGLPANGAVDIPQPQITTTYTLTAVGCGQTRQMQVTVVVNSCPIPSINSFSANPSVVSAGGNENVLFNWNISGQVDSLSIDQGIGVVSGSSHSILQPQTTTTYTLTAVGCGQNIQSQVTVLVELSSNVCQHNQRYDLTVYTFPSEQFLIINSSMTVSNAGVVNGSVEVDQLQSEIVELLQLEVTLYDSQNRVVFNRLETANNGAFPSNITLTNVSPLVPVPANSTTYYLRFRWFGQNNTGLEQNTTDIWTITPSGCS